MAFVAAEVSSYRAGDMKISTPTATLRAFRGTTGLVEVPENAAANNPNNVAIKLYPDADGRVGRIEVNDRNGARLGFLTQGSSGFTIRPGAGGRFTAAPLLISPQQALLSAVRASCARSMPRRASAARSSASSARCGRPIQTGTICATIRRGSPACSDRTACRNGRMACRSVPARRKRRASKIGNRIVWSKIVKDKSSRRQAHRVRQTVPLCDSPVHHRLDCSGPDSRTGPHCNAARRRPRASPRRNGASASSFSLAPFLRGEGRGEGRANREC